jgi:type III restriction enzyme
MSNIELFPFQTGASDKILERFVELTDDPDRPMQTARWATPYYQALAALTGAGKTPILADAASQLRAAMSVEPIVFWISKAKAVVDQTTANFESGGKYSHLIPDFIVVPLPELREDHIRDGDTPILVLATVGSFNQKSKEDGSLKVHKPSHDKNRDALWRVLRERPNSDVERRPLVIVYDEAQNLSDQQTDLLLELEPDAFLAASATMRTPTRLAKLIERLRDCGWTDERLVTTVKSLDVVNMGLVKRQLILGGYATDMELALDDMLAAMKSYAKKAKRLNVGFQPKAIYVCRTNISQIDGTKDIASRPFAERQAPPILIWRYLVEKHGINPDDIALYCDLKMDHKHNPPPEGFHLFNGGEDDFASFSAGNFHHIIFNQSLQEGWDDPECCFAYIDKSMGSAVQVEQVIGRVLRQPGARHYPDADLNSAHFYIRIDDKQVFPQILKAVRKEIGGEIPDIAISGFTDRKDRNRIHLEPRREVTVPEIHILCDLEPIYEEIENVVDYRNDNGDNIIGKGERYRAVQGIGDGSTAEVVVTTMKHSNRVTARWIVRRGIQSLYPRATMSIDLTGGKFDARVEVTSRAANDLKDAAEKLVDAYLQHSSLAFEDENLYTVGPVVVNPAKVKNFTHSIHEGYSDISNSEMPYADALDSLGHPWARNPVNGGFAIPLLQTGGTYNFYPDFLVWKDDVIFALDPKGAHLLVDAAGRKMLDIRDEDGKQKVVVRMFTEGKWEEPGKKKSNQGITVWVLASGGTVRPKHYPTIEQAVEGALRLR